MTQSYQSKLKTECEICEIQENRLKMSLQHLTPFLPITPDFIKNADVEKLGLLDMATTRFSKIQDILGKQIFILILRLTGEFDERDTFIDKLNRLEKLGVINSVEQWKELRDIRNALSHEYENDLVKLCKALNYFFEKCDELLQIWKNTQEYIKDKKLA